MKEICNSTTEQQVEDAMKDDTAVTQEQEHPEYVHIPLVLREFIRGRNDFLETKDNQVVADLLEKESHVCSTFYIPVNEAEEIVARFDLIYNEKSLPRKG